MVYSVFTVLYIYKYTILLIKNKGWPVREFYKFKLFHHLKQKSGFWEFQLLA